MKKIFFREPKNYFDQIRIQIMKAMALDLCSGVIIEDLYPAEDVEGMEGIFCSTREGGKKFWSYDELERLYARKNNELKRFRL